MLMNVNHAVEARMSQWLPFSMRWPDEKIYLVGVIISENGNKMAKSHGGDEVELDFYKTFANAMNLHF